MARRRRSGSATMALEGWRRRRVAATRAEAETMGEGRALTIAQQEDDQRYKLMLSGELDLASAPELEAALTRLCTAGAIEIEIDLRRLILIDSSGLRAILRAQAKCAEHHTEFFLTLGRHPAQRMSEFKQLELPWRAPGPGPV